MTFGSSRDDPLERVQAFVRLLVVARRLARLRHQVEQLNLVLGIGEPGAIGRERGHERADVAERGEPRPRVGIDFDRRLRRRGVVRHPLLERDQLLVHAIAERLALGVEVVQTRPDPAAGRRARAAARRRICSDPRSARAGRSSRSESADRSPRSTPRGRAPASRRSSAARRCCPRAAPTASRRAVRARSAGCRCCGRCRRRAAPPSRRTAPESAAARASSPGRRRTRACLRRARRGSRRDRP